MTPELVTVNGKKIDSISVLDRGFQYGDGLFETMAIINEWPRLWARHKQRLIKGMQVLGIPDLDESELEQEIRELCRNQQQCTLKLIVTRGNSAGGYACANTTTPNRILMRFSWSQRSPLATLRLCTTRLGIAPHLAGMKHLNRLEQVLARAEWQDEFDEGIVLDMDGRVIECVMHNIFLVLNGILMTPSLDRCGVRGVMRDHVLALAHRLGIVTEESDITLEQLWTADEVFITNAVSGIRAVSLIGERSIPGGPITQRLQEALPASFL